MNRNTMKISSSLHKKPTFPPSLKKKNQTQINPPDFKAWTHISVVISLGQKYNCFAYKQFVLYFNLLKNAQSDCMTCFGFHVVTFGAFYHVVFLYGPNNFSHSILSK